MIKNRSKIKIQLAILTVIFLCGVLLVLLVQNLHLSIQQNQYIDFEKQAKTIVEKCSKSAINGWKDCIGVELGTFNKTTTFANSIILEQKVEEYDPRTVDCHLIAHRLASSEIEKNPNKWLDIFDLVDHTTCNSGYLHGVLEAKRRVEKNFVINANTVPTICQQVEDKIKAKNPKKLESLSFDNSCAHVMGHLLLAESFGNINDAIKGCEGFSSNSNKFCLDGVFMENLLRENLEEHQIVQKMKYTTDLAHTWEKLCKSYPPYISPSCWREVGTIYTELSHYEPKEVYTNCFQNSTKKVDAEECYFNALNHISLSAGFDIRKMTDACLPFQTSQSEASICISKVISPMLVGGLKLVNNTIAFCETLKEDFKPQCYRKIGFFVQKYRPTRERNSTCENVPQNYKRLCIGQ